MSEYRIRETDQFTKDIRAIAKSGRKTVLIKLRQMVYPQLRRSPRFGPDIRKLRGYAPDTWRYRIGPWRFFYGIDDEQQIVILLAASRRGSAY